MLVIEKYFTHFTRAKNEALQWSNYLEPTKALAPNLHLPSPYTY